MTTTVTTKKFVQRVYDTLNDQDRDAFTALCADDSLLHSGDKDFQGLDAANQNSAVAGHCEIACQRRRRHVSR
jgi:hypothetical protein